jgi:hypothetical protein
MNLADAGFINFYGDVWDESFLGKAAIHDKHYPYPILKFLANHEKCSFVTEKKIDKNDTNKTTIFEWIDKWSEERNNSQPNKREKITLLNKARKKKRVIQRD